MWAGDKLRGPSVPDLRRVRDEKRVGLVGNKMAAAFESCGHFHLGQELYAVNLCPAFRP